LNSKHFDQKQQTTHSIPINIQLLMKNIAMIISQSVGGSCMLIMLKKIFESKLINNNTYNINIFILFPNKNINIPKVLTLHKKTAEN